MGDCKLGDDEMIISNLCFYVCMMYCLISTPNGHFTTNIDLVSMNSKKKHWITVRCSVYLCNRLT